MRNELEKEIEKKLRRMIESRGGKCLKWVCPGWSGVPDRLAILPGGRVYFIETKRPKGGRYSRMQDWWRDTLIGLGCNYYRIKDAEGIAAFEALPLCFCREEPKP